MKRTTKICLFTFVIVSIVAMAIGSLSASADPAITWTEVNANNFYTAMENDGYYKLTEDVGSDSALPFVSIGSNVTLDLNGHSIKTNYASVFYQKAGVTPGTIVITDNTEEKTGSIESSNGALLENIAGNVTIDGGLMITKDCQSAASTATVVITGTATKFNPSPYLPTGYTFAFNETLNYISLKDYKITYSLGSTSISPVTNHEDNPETYTVMDTVTFQAPERSGYTFAGWVDASDAPITGIVAGSINDITIKATWTIIDYTVTYVLNDNTAFTAANTNVTTYNANSIAINLVDATRPGYTFDGWYDAATEGNKVTQIDPGAFENITLYARWTPKTYNIVYNLDAGTNDEANPTTFTVEDTVTFQPASKNGYVFDGWFDAATGGNQVTGVTIVNNAEQATVNVFAHYSPKTYNIKINYVCANGFNNGDVIYSDTTTFAACPIGTVLNTVVPLDKINGYVPEEWTIDTTVTYPGEMNDFVYIVYVTPVILKSEVVGSTLKVTYFDDTVREYELGSVVAITLDDDGKLSYNVNGSTTAVEIGNIAESKDITELQAEIAKVNTAIAQEKTATKTTTDGISANLAAEALKIVTNTTNITKATADLEALTSKVDGIEDKTETNASDIEDLRSDFKTFVVIVIVVLVLLTGSVVFLYVKQFAKKK